MTLFLTWLVLDLLIAALLLSQARGLIIAALWLALALIAGAVFWPVLVILAALRRVGLASAS